MPITTRFGEHPRLGYKEWGRLSTQPVSALPSQQPRIYNGTWDTLFILDACRYDMLHVALQGIDDIEDVEPVRSEGDRTKEWLEWMWQSDDDGSSDIPDVTYYSGTPWTSSQLTNDRRVDLHENVTVKQLGTNLTDDHDDGNDLANCWMDIGTLDPECAVREVAQDDVRGKKVIHLMQPHYPFIGNIKFAVNERAPDADELSYIADLVRDDIVAPEFFRAAYYYNMIYGLESVSEYAQLRPDETLSITSDHGEVIDDDGVTHSAHTPIPFVTV